MNFYLKKHDCCTHFELTIEREGELRRLVRIQFEGVQVGFLRDQFSKRAAFQVLNGLKATVDVNI